MKYNDTKPKTRFFRPTLGVVSTAILLVLAGCNNGGGTSVSGEDNSADIADIEAVTSAEFEEQEGAFDGGDNFWAELAQSYEPFVKPPSLGAATAPEDWVSLGNWEETFDWPLIASGAANMPDGRIVAWASQDIDAFGGNQTKTHGTIFDPISGTFEETENSTHDMFCAGISMLADGKVFVAGGGKTVSSVSVFDETEFVEIESMAMTRWYPTSTTLASGQVFTSLGTIASPYPEIWTDGKGWTLLPQVDLQTILDAEDAVHNDWYPALNVAPDGSLFHPGHMPGVLSIYMDQEDTVTHHGEREDDDVSRLYNTSVMYDVGKMLVAGGGSGADATNTALTMDVNGPTPVISSIEPMKHVRSMQNSVVLPNGEVLVIGGNTSGIQFSDNGTVLEPEMWNPVTENWRPLALHDKPRNYHSVALLMKDARVLSAGGGLCGACPTNHQNGEIYSPPYLFNTDGTPAPRPSITGGPKQAIAGEVIGISGSNDIEQFNMVRLVAITHHHTTDQRFIPVDSVKSGNGSYHLTLNGNPNVLLPGYYWVFGLNADGTPSEGHTIQINISPESLPSENADTTPNIAFEYYEENWPVWELPDFDTLTPVKTGAQADFSLAQKERTNWYGFRFRGAINVPETGEYTFFLSSDDGSRVIINNETIVDYDGPHSFEGEEEGSVTLTAGVHNIEVQFFEVTGGDALLVSWEGPSIDKRPISPFDLGSALGASQLANTNPGPAIDGKVSYRYFHGEWNNVPNFDNLTPLQEGEVDGFDLSPALRDNLYAFEFTANINIPTDGSYTFYTTSDDGSVLSVDGVKVVDNDGLHAARERSGTIPLSAGNHRIKIGYFERTGGDSLKVSWSGPGLAKQVISTTALSSNGSIITAGNAGGGTGDNNNTTPGNGNGNGGTVTAAPVISTPNSVNYKYYEGTWNKLPNFANLTPVKEGLTTGFVLDEREQDDFFAMQFSGQLIVPTTGVYTLFTRSDDGSRILIDGQELIDHDGLHPPTEKQGNVNLSAGAHDIVVEYFEKDRGNTLAISWQGPGIAKQAIPLTALASVGTISDTATPTAPVVALGDGLVNYEYFEGTWTSLPNFDQLTPLATGTQESFALTPKLANEFYGFRFTTNLLVSEAQQYTFYIKSDDGSRLSINGDVVVDNDGLHGSRERNGSTFLEAGSHEVVVEFFERTGADSLTVSWSSVGAPKVALDTASLSSTEIDVIPNTAGTTAVPVTLPNTQAPAPAPAAATAAPAPSDMLFAYYEGTWTSLPRFDLMFPVASGDIADFTLPPSNGVLNYGYRITGQILITESDLYTFYTASNDGSQLRIDNTLIVDNDGRHGVVEKNGSIQLEPGLHDIELVYFQSGGSEALDVFWSTDTQAKQHIDGNVLFAP